MSELNSSIPATLSADKPKGMSLWKKIMIGMILGATLGLVWGPDAALIKPLGTLFINAIKMLIVPLVFCSLVVGVTSMQDTAKMGRIGLKSTMLYISTTAIAITIGLVLALIVVPGEGLNMVQAETASAVKEAPSVVNTFLNMIPKNPVDALAGGKCCK